LWFSIILVANECAFVRHIAIFETEASRRRVIDAGIVSIPGKKNVSDVT